jgi:SagB-type dehydrogenase family enzyme
MKSDISLVRQYQELISSRKRGYSGPLVPTDHEINWKDAPPKLTSYPEYLRVPLPSELVHQQLEVGVRPSPSPQNFSSISIGEISDFLLLTSGILRRKLLIDWNHSHNAILGQPNAIYSRGTASGGGLYPIEVYLVPRVDKHLPRGVYHYDVARHSLRRLRVGNFDSVTSRALNYPGTQSVDLFVVLTIRFSKNTFKYHNLGYQLATQDAGALIGSMEQVSFALGWNITIFYWFCDRLFSSLLGLQTNHEAPLLVLAARTDYQEPLTEKEGVSGVTHTPHQVLPLVPVRARGQSNDVSVPEMLLKTHESTLIETIERPQVSSPFERSTKGATLEDRLAISGRLHSILLRRTSSWGRLRRHPPLEISVLKRLLSFTTFGVDYRTDLFDSNTAPPTVRLLIIAQYVRDLPEGVYEYSQLDSDLRPQRIGALNGFTQSLCFGSNYNLEQVAATLVIVGRLEAALSVFGERAIRVINAETGIFAQRAYIASASLALGCGAVAGFDAGRVCELTGIDRTEEIPLLLVFVGNEQAAAESFRFHLY